MTSLFGKLLTPTLLVGMLAISAPASADDNSCEDLAKSINAILALNKSDLLPVADKLVDRMEFIGCDPALIPVVPKS
jgi:hypothetical protein